MRKVKIITGSGAEEFYPAAEVDKESAALKAERDEAINNANNYRVRVINFLDAIILQSEKTQEIEERHGLNPTQREETRRVVEYIKQVFSSHNYLTEAKVEGEIAKGVASGEFVIYKNE
jgi:hypothetical protein